MRYWQQECNYSQAMLNSSQSDFFVATQRTFSPSPVVTPRHHLLGEPDDYLYRNNYRPFLARIIP
jgi:hypothetical protein